MTGMRVRCTPAAVWASAVVLLALALLAGCASAPEQGTGDGKPNPEAVEVIETGLEAPWSITFVGETPLVSERDSARILELDTRGKSSIVATIEGVAPRGEGGLLGIAVHDGYLYAYLTAPGENRVERLKLQGASDAGANTDADANSNSGSLTLTPAETIIEGIPAAGNHNGGRIAFGPDGMLYITTGDAGDPPRAQDLESLGGKILRVTPMGDVPEDNPFPGSPVFTLGHRNPQGIAWASDGTMFASEFGQNTWDELNIIEAGNNYGWPEVEGIADSTSGDTNNADTHFTNPVQQWPTSEASPSGIAVAGGTIYVANLRGQRLREVPVTDPSKTTAERFVGELGRLRDVVAAPDGSLWVLTNNTDGRGQPAADDDRIVRIEPAKGKQ